MAKNLWNNAKLPNWNKIGELFEFDIYQFAEKVYEKKLADIVAPFETDIPFQTILDDSKNNSIIRVEPIPGIYSSNRVSGEIETATLFKYLNDGTNTNYAVMPDDFSNETFPGTLNTVASRYNRKRIFLDFNKGGGIQGRRWLEILEEMYRQQLKFAAFQSLQKHVNKR